MLIQLAETDADVLACFPVMAHLRPRITEKTWLAQVRRLQPGGYHLAFIRNDAGAVVAAAGFRLGENLPWGRHLYVDDLVTLPTERSHGYGTAMLKWLHVQARKQDCDEVHLDSGFWRHAAHRFYEREGMERTSFHFRTDLRTGESRSWVPVLTPAYAYVWEYDVPAEHRSAFVERYAPGGAWVRLFEGATGYVRTDLLEDTFTPGRFVTMDQWDSRASFDAFRVERAAEFEALDRECDAFTRRESELGKFRVITGTE